MGIDCEILFESVDGTGQTDVYWRQGWCVEDASQCNKEDYPGCTHYVYTLCRYFGPYYPRGPWPEILHHLVGLLRDRNVARVWYGGDGGIGLQEVNEELLLGLTSVYISGKEES